MISTVVLGPERCITEGCYYFVVVFSIYFSKLSLRIQPHRVVTSPSRLPDRIDPLRNTFSLFKFDLELYTYHTPNNPSPVLFPSLRLTPPYRYPISLLVGLI